MIQNVKLEKETRNWEITAEDRYKLIGNFRKFETTKKYFVDVGSK